MKELGQMKNSDCLQTQVNIQLVRARKGKADKTRNHKVPNRHLNHCRKLKIYCLSQLILTTQTILALRERSAERALKWASKCYSST